MATASAMDATTSLKYTICYEEAYLKLQELKVNKKKLVFESLEDVSEKMLLNSNLCLEPPPYTSEAAKVEFAQAKSIMLKRILRLLTLLKKKWNRCIPPSEKMSIFLIW